MTTEKCDDATRLAMEYEERTLHLMERCIRERATNVANYLMLRSTHPSYGYSKTMIRAAVAEMEGMIGMYMVVTGQANHTGASALAEFDDGDTTARVIAAREAVARL